MSKCFLEMIQRNFQKIIVLRRSQLGSPNTFPTPSPASPFTNIKYDGGPLVMFMRSGVGDRIGKALGDPIDQISGINRKMIRLKFKIFNQINTKDPF